MSIKRSNRSTREELWAENEEIRARLREAEETLAAIREGEVDAIVVSGGRGEQVFSLTGAEHVYRRIVETMHEAALTVSLDGQVLFCNRQFSRLLRMPPERIVGRRLDEMVAPGERGEVEPLLERSHAFPVTQRLVFQGEGAPAVPVHLSAVALSTLEGESVCIVATDLSELESSNQLIQQLRRHQEALQESEQRLRLALDAAQFGTFDYHPQTGQVIWDDHLKRIWGIAAEETLDYSAVLRRIHPEDRERFSQVFAASLDPKGSGHYEAQYRILWPDGSVRWTSTRGRVQFLGEGEHRRAVRVTGIEQDITERKRSEEALKRLNETLEQQVAERTRLAEARSRQLQALAVQLIRAEEQERRRIGMLLHEDVQQILASGKMRLHALEPHLKGGLTAHSILQQVSRLLDESLSRCRLLAQDLSPPVLYHAGLSEALEMLARAMKEKHDLAARVESDPTPWKRLAGMPIALFLYRTVQELLFNVVKHAGVLQATVRLAHRGDRLEVEVADGGRGFDPASLKTRSGTEAGFGLLSIEERSRSLGGAFTIESAPGRGSRLKITLPVPGPAGLQEEADLLDGKRGSAAAGVGSRPVEPVPDGEPARYRLLLVDDHAILREGLLAVLGSQPGIQVVGEASDGEEAVELARVLAPDVVLMDLRMPKMDGIEATRRIKAERPEVRVIGLSMFGEQEAAHAMHQAGAEAFVSKGESAEVVLKAIYRMSGKEKSL